MRLKRFQVLAALLIAFRDPRKPFFRSLLVFCPMYNLHN